MNLKASWNASNHNLNYLPQVTTFQGCIHCFEIRELYPLARAQRRENSTANWKFLRSGAGRAAPLSSQSNAKPELIWPQNCRDGKHPDAMIKEFRALLDHTQDMIHRMAIYSGRRECIKHMSRNKMNISDIQLHAMELYMSDGIKVPIERCEGEPISEMCRRTRSQSWHGGDQRTDWVWVKQCRGRWYGVLNWCFPWQLQWLFKIKLLNKDEVFVEYWLALALTTVSENSGNLNPVSKFIQGRKSLAAVALHVFSVGNIVGFAHVIPAIATSCKTGDGRKEQ